MVQLKYYGDDRDYFKYDLISVILKEIGFDNYGFVPMLTKHRDDNEGSIAPKQSDCKSKELLRFICSHSTPDLNNWELWLKKFVPSYLTVQPINSIYIGNRDRNDYWSKFSQVIASKRSLIFLDPDTGIQAGRKTKISCNQYEKYILDGEISNLLEQLPETSVFIIYQHLQRDSKKHESDMKRKIDALSGMATGTKVSAYREKDLAFLFVAKASEIHKKIQSVIRKYCTQSTVNPRNIYLRQTVGTPK